MNREISYLRNETHLRELMGNFYKSNELRAEENSRMLLHRR